MTTKYRAIAGPATLGLIAATFLSGCGGSSSSSSSDSGLLQNAEFAVSSFASTDLDGFVARTLSDETEYRFRDGIGVGYAYKGGIDASGNYATLVGINNEDRLTPPTFQGSADFNGEARAIYANVNRLFTDASVQELTAPILVRANLDTGFFEGRTSGGNLDLNISGTIRDGAMTGTGEFSNRTVQIDTTVSGNVGQNRMVGIFHGAGSAVSVAGGIYATR